MKLVLKYSIDGGEPCGSYDITTPFEYESVEKAEYDLFCIWEKHAAAVRSFDYSNKNYGEQIFAGIRINLRNLTYFERDKLHKREIPKYIEPIILTLEDWWEKYQEREI